MLFKTAFYPAHCR